MPKAHLLNQLEGHRLSAGGSFLELFVHKPSVSGILSVCSISSTCTELLLDAKNRAKCWWSKGTKALTSSLQTSVSLAHKHKQIITICDENYKSMNILFCHIYEESLFTSLRMLLREAILCPKGYYSVLKFSQMLCISFLKSFNPSILRLFLIWPMMKQSNNGIIFPHINSSSLVTDICILIGQPFRSTSLLSVTSPSHCLFNWPLQFYFSQLSGTCILLVWVHSPTANTHALLFVYILIFASYMTVLYWFCFTVKTYLKIPVIQIPSFLFSNQASWFCNCLNIGLLYYIQIL